MANLSAQFTTPSNQIKVTYWLILTECVTVRYCHSNQYVFNILYLYVCRLLT